MQHNLHQENQSVNSKAAQNGCMNVNVRNANVISVNGNNNCDNNKKKEGK